MAKGARSSMLLMVISIAALVSLSESLKKPVGVARKEDVPFIKCQVCQKLASELHRQVHNKQAQISPKKISEFQIIEITENICNLKKEEADWILKIDIVEQEDKLKLVDQDTEGQCNSECKTIERACQEDRAPGEPFIPKPAKEAEMEKMLRSMEGMPGAPSMKMYSREELMNMKNFGGGDPDEEDDDSDDEENFQSKLGRVLREKENKKVDWKENIRKQLFSAGDTLKGHANKVANRLRRWWRAKKTANSKEKSSGKPEL
ncbi:hypothetical protein Ancab_016955 [Ancistrocladus abbreviatus]